jgi:ribonuclease I
MSNFDYFLLAFSYAPTFCKLNPDKQNSIECVGNYGLVLHGLWPEDNDGSYPQFCNYPVKYSKTELQDIIKKIDEWEKYAPEYLDLCVHEWEKHGTCSGLNPQQYFNLAFISAKKFYKDVPENSSEQDIKNLFLDGKIDFKNNMFYGVTFKVNKNEILLNITFDENNEFVIVEKKD